MDDDLDTVTMAPPVSGTANLCSGAAFRSSQESYVLVTVDPIEQHLPTRRAASGSSIRSRPLNALF
jgi:hypothetical protein